MIASKKSFSLRENCRLRLLKDMLGSLKTKFPNVNNFIMVVDPITLRIVSSCIKMIELMEEGVIALEKLELVRKQFPTAHAIYFITPIDDSIKQLIKDFKDKKKPQYCNAHIYFTNRVDQEYMDKLGKEKELINRLLTLKELNLDFLCPEENLFHFDMPEAFPVVFSKYGLAEERKLSELIANKLATVIPTLFDYQNFHIVYNKNEANGIAEKIAKVVHDRINKFLEFKTKNDDDDSDPPAPIKIVILDRSFDPVTPVLHDYYYQSMIYDLLEVNNNTVEYNSEDSKGKNTKKKAILSDNDDLWVKYKYKHIAEAMTLISEEFQNFVETNKTAQTQKADMNNLDLKTMSEIVKQMPLYNELLSKYTLHMNLVEQCLKAFKEKELKEIGEVEQCLATGLDNAGKVVTTQKLIAMIATRLAMGKLNPKDKLRLLMIVCVAMELAEKDRKTFTQSLSQEDQLILSKLIWLGINPAKIVKGKVSNKLANISEKAKNKSKAISFDLCRATPQVETIANMVSSGNIDKNQFGSLFIPKSYDGSMAQRSKITAGSIMNMKKQGNKNANWNENMDDKHQPKFIFFIIGGITYPEIRVLKEFEMSNAYINVITGSTSIMSPQDYIDGIGKMLTPQEYNDQKNREPVVYEIKTT